MTPLKQRKMIEFVPPEGVPLRFEIARVADRLVAVVIDMAVIMGSIISLILGILLLLSVGGITSPFSASVFGSLLILGMFFLRQGYFFFFELKWQGSTPGKRVSKLRVISRSGSSLTLAALISRNLFRDLELFLPLGILLSPTQIAKQPMWVWVPMLCWVGVMVALPLLNRYHLRLGDFVAGTMVVRVPKAELLVDKAAATSSFAIRGEIPFSSKQLSIYGEYELETLAEILRKVDEGKADVLDLQVIAKTIARKIGYEGDEPQQEPLRFLRAFYTKQRAYLEAHLLFGQRKASKND